MHAHSCFDGSACNILMNSFQATRRDQGTPSYSHDKEPKSQICSEFMFCVRTAIAGNKFQPVCQLPVCTHPLTSICDAHRSSLYDMRRKGCWLSGTNTMDVVRISCEPRKLMVRTKWMRPFVFHRAWRWSRLIIAALGANYYYYIPSTLSAHEFTAAHFIDIALIHRFQSKSCTFVVNFVYF